MSRSISLPAGIETTEVVDADGIPQWMQHPELGFHHGNPRQVAFAWECLSFQFHLAEFDLWLSQRPSSTLKTQFLEHRHKAQQAFEAGDEAGLVAQLQILDARLQGVLKHPLAQAGHRWNKRQREVARKSRRPESLEESIKHMASREHRKPRELWGPFADRLRQHGCVVTDMVTDTGELAIEVADPDGKAYEYTLKAFSNAVREERNKSR